MNRMNAAFAGLLLLVVLGSHAVPQQPPAARKSMFSLLKPGQAVELNQHQGGDTFFRIFEDEDLKATMKQTIKEVHEDYVVISSPTNPQLEKWGSIEQYLPLHAVSAIVIVKKKDAK